MIAAIVMVKPQPMAFANGSTKAEAAAEKRYRTTGNQSESHDRADDVQLLTAMTSADRCCMQSTALYRQLILGGLTENILGIQWCESDHQAEAANTSHD